MIDTVKLYDARAAELGAQYEQIDAEALHKEFLDLLPEGRDRLVLDVGAGSGRDAAWLAARGFEVVAVDPAAAMREAAWLADEALGARFRQECAAALPVSVDAGASELFDGLAWRRLRLRQDQQVPEWVRRPETSRQSVRA